MSAETLINAKGVSVRIERPTYTTDSGGGQVQAWGLVGYTKMFIQPQGGDETDRYGGESNRRYFQAFASVNCGLRDGDRVVWGSRTFDVQIHNKAGEFTSGILAHMVIELEETKTDQ